MIFVGGHFYEKYNSHLPLDSLKYLPEFRQFCLNLLRVNGLSGISLLFNWHWEKIIQSKCEVTLGNTGKNITCIDTNSSTRKGNTKPYVVFMALTICGGGNVVLRGQRHLPERTLMYSGGPLIELLYICIHTLWMLLRMTLTDFRYDFLWSNISRSTKVIWHGIQITNSKTRWFSI